MYTIDDLNVRLLSELKEIAEGMGIKNAKKLTKQDLIYKILDQQAVSGEAETAAPAPKKASSQQAEPERKMRPRRRENVAPVAPKTEEAEMSSDDLLDSINLDFDSSVTKFEDKEVNEERSEREGSFETPTRQETRDTRENRDRDNRDNREH